MKRSWKEAEDALKEDITVLKTSINKTKLEMDGESQFFENEKNKLLNELKNREFYIS